MQSHCSGRSIHCCGRYCNIRWPIFCFSKSDIDCSGFLVQALNVPGEWGIIAIILLCRSYKWNTTKMSTTFSKRSVMYLGLTIHLENHTFVLPAPGWISKAQANTGVKHWKTAHCQWDRPSTDAVREKSTISGRMGGAAIGDEGHIPHFCVIWGQGRTSSKLRWCKTERRLSLYSNIFANSWLLSSVSNILIGCATFRCAQLLDFVANFTLYSSVHVISCRQCIIIVVQRQ